MSVFSSVNSRIPSAFGVALLPKRIRSAGQVIAYECPGGTVLPAGAIGCNDAGYPINANGLAMVAIGTDLPLGSAAAHTALGSAPRNAQGKNANGDWVDAGGNVLDANGNIVRQIVGTLANCQSTGVVLSQYPGAVSCNSAGQPIDSNGNVVAPPAPQPQPGTLTFGTPSGPTTEPINTPEKTAQDMALYNTVAPLIGFTGDGIQAAIASNNTQQLAVIRLNSQAQIAQLQIQAQQATASGDLALAEQKSQEAAQLQQLNMQLGATGSSLTALYVIAAVVVVGIGAAMVYSKRNSSPAPRLDRPARAERSSRSGGSTPRLSRANR